MESQGSYWQRGQSINSKGQLLQVNILSLCGYLVQFYPLTDVRKYNITNLENILLS